MTGHRPSYVRRIVNIAIKHEYRVLLAMPSTCFKHSVIEKLFASTSVEKLVPIHCASLNTENPSTNIGKMLFNEFLCARFYHKSMTTVQRQFEVDLIVVGMFDDASIYSGLFGFDFRDTPWLGIVMRQIFHFDAMETIGPAKSRMTSFKHHLFLRLLRSLKNNASLLTIDSTLKDYINRDHRNLADRIGFLPDAVDDRGNVTQHNLRADLAIPEYAFVILCYGSLRVNKGVRLLIDIMSQLPDNVHALIVGTQSPSIKQHINCEKNKPLLQSGRIHQIDRYIDVSEDANFFTAADVVWVGYKNYFTMSAVLVQAAQYHKPVLATQNGLIGKLTNEHNTGVTVDTTNMTDVINGVHQLMHVNSTTTTRHYDNLVAIHNLESFENALIGAFNKVENPTT